MSKYKLKDETISQIFSQVSDEVKSAFTAFFIIDDFAFYSEGRIIVEVVFSIDPTKLALKEDVIVEPDQDIAVKLVQFFNYHNDDLVGIIARYHELQSKAVPVDE